MPRSYTGTDSLHIDPKYIESSHLPAALTCSFHFCYRDFG
jgi:hypothetical protein